MRISRLISAALVAPLALSAIAAGTGEGGEAPVELYSACANPGGLTVVTPSASATKSVATPIGALIPVTETDAGSYIVDLAGRPVGSITTVRLELSWSEVLLADYDMEVNGTAYESSETTELAEIGAGHCSTFATTAYSFIGTPADSLTMKVSAS